VNWEFWLPLLVLASSLVTALINFGLGEERHILRNTLNLTGATVKLVLVAIIFWGEFHGRLYEARWEFLPGLDLALRVDPLALLFVTLSAILWLVTTIYAIGYLEEAPNRRRFFGFFSLCVTATMGVALAGNLITFLFFYELLTIATYPLVIHRGTEEALRAGRTYLLYTVGGGALLLTGIVWLHGISGPVEFVSGGVLGEVAEDYRYQLIAIFAVMIAGLGVKAAIVPFHGWLPRAMVAPAPVSALLHAVAVVKAGAFGIVRIIYDVYGLGFAASLGVLQPLSVLAAVTIIYGSVKALSQDDLKRRLAYSTISQLSYIVLGTTLFGPLGTVGGLVHLMHQGFMKITLFFCAGNLAETLGIHHIHEMNGVGRRMPLTMAAFTVAAFGMIGIPPVAGFISKWYLGLGAIESGQQWVIPVLIVSSLLNSAYFLPILFRAWFREPDGEWTELQPRGRLEVGWMLLAPPVTTALLALAAGLFAGWGYSPLGLAEEIVQDLYAQ
jgi:multicomponent Na+:H+ antiporter subunit D